SPHLAPPSFGLHPLPGLSLESERTFMPIFPDQPRFPPNPRPLPGPQSPRRRPQHKNTERSHFSFLSKQNTTTYLSATKPVSPYRNQAAEYDSVRWASDCLTHSLVLLNKGNRKLKESSKAIVGNLLNRGLSRNGSGKYGDAPPLRSELLSAEQMKQHGRTLAELHKLSPG